MTYCSVYFVVFFAITVVAYFAMPLAKRWIVLLISSIIFYVIAGIEFIPYILLVSAIGYSTAVQINCKYDKLESLLQNENLEKQEKQKLKKKTQKECKLYVAMAITIIIGILCFTKFTNMAIEVLQNLADICGIHSVHLSEIPLIFPLGISYYTFSTIGYLLDVYWKRYRAEYNAAKFILYVCFFPHIVQGPIARYNRLAPQLFEGHRFDYIRMCNGLQLMLWGGVKKLVIADRLAIFVNNVYSGFENERGFILVIATVFYSFQLYTDFSGCMDMTKGMSQILGITLEDNFRQPYFSQSVAEFWRRWHITLGTWFKDYLYMPVSISKLVRKYSQKAKNKWGNQAGKNVITIFSLGVVWLATGIWHGTGWNYIVWGIWHGSLLIGSTLLDQKFIEWKQKLGIEDGARYWKIFRICRTFVLTAFIPRIITRAGTIPVAISIFKNIFSQFNIWVFFDDSLYAYGLDRRNFWLVLIALMLLLIVSFLHERGICVRDSIAKKKILVRWTIYYALIFSIIIFGIYGSGYDASSFIYAQF